MTQDVVNRLQEISMFGFLAKENSVARPGFNRWMVPPAALAVHLCIGQAYAFSVFNGPLSKLIGIDSPAPDDWKLTTLCWIFRLENVVLGLAAAFGGKRMDSVVSRLSIV